MLLGFARQLIRDLLAGASRPQDRSRPNPHTKRSETMNAHVPFSCPPHLQLEISKAVYQLDFFARSIQLPGWPTAEKVETWKHDLGVMRAFDDLKQITLELLDGEGAVLHEFQITFGHAPGNGQSIVDSAQGVEVVVLSAEQRRQVKSFRFLIRNHRQDGSYKHLLKLNWNPADTRMKRAQHAYDSEHARKITGGRCQGGVRVADSARHVLRITQAGARGYAFADSDEADGLKNVFCHERYAPPGLALQPGRVIRAIVVQSPRGLQARSIEVV